MPLHRARHALALRPPEKRRPDGKFFSGDGGDEEMVAHAKDGKWLYLFRPQVIPDVACISAPNSESLIRPGTLVPEKLVNMKTHDYRLEPNMFFTVDARAGS